MLRTRPSSDEVDFASQFEEDIVLTLVLTLELTSAFGLALTLVLALTLELTLELELALELTLAMELILTLAGIVVAVIGMAGISTSRKKSLISVAFLLRRRQHGKC